MTLEKAIKLILVISLGFAALIILSSFFLPSDDNMKTVTFVLITIWLIPFSYLIKLKKKATQKSLNTKEEE